MGPEPLPVSGTPTRPPDAPSELLYMRRCKGLLLELPGEFQIPFKFNELCAFAVQYFVSRKYPTVAVH
jgi:hypothetical protein